MAPRLPAGGFFLKYFTSGLNLKRKIRSNVGILQVLYKKAESPRNHIAGFTYFYKLKTASKGTATGTLPYGIVIRK